MSSNDGALGAVEPNSRILPENRVGFVLPFQSRVGRAVAISFISVSATLGTYNTVHSHEQATELRQQGDPQAAEEKDATTSFSMRGVVGSLILGGAYIGDTFYGACLRRRQEDDFYRAQHPQGE